MAVMTTTKDEFAFMQAFSLLNQHREAFNAHIWHLEPEEIKEIKSLIRIKLKRWTNLNILNRIHTYTMEIIIFLFKKQIHELFLQKTSFISFRSSLDLISTDQPFFDGIKSINTKNKSETQIFDEIDPMIVKWLIVWKEQWDQDSNLIELEEKCRIIDQYNENDTFYLTVDIHSN